MQPRIFTATLFKYHIYISWEPIIKWYYKKKIIVNKNGEIPDYIPIKQPYYYHFHLGHIWMRWVKTK